MSSSNRASLHFRHIALAYVVHLRPQAYGLTLSAIVLVLGSSGPAAHAQVPDANPVCDEKMDANGNFHPCSWDPRSGPSAAVIEAERRAAEVARLRAEATAANSRGVDAFDKGNYAAAVALFQQALTKNPDDRVITRNLQNAKEAQDRKQAESEFNQDKGNAVAAMQDLSNGGLQIGSLGGGEGSLQLGTMGVGSPLGTFSETQHGQRSKGIAGDLKTAEYESQTAKPLPPDAAKYGAANGFDSAGTPKGSISVPVFAGNSSGIDPVVSNSQRTPEITSLEHQRSDVRTQVAQLESQKKSSAFQNNQVKVAQINQTESALQQKVQYINFQISKKLTQQIRK